MDLSLAGAPYSVRCLSAVTYGTADGNLPLSLDLLLPEPRPASPVPAVAYIHGGAWRYGDRSAGLYPWNSPVLTAHGFVTVNVGYRLTDRAPFPAQAHDVKAAIRWLRANATEYGIDPDRIGVWGDSAGGHLAALVGTTGGIAELEGDCGSPDESSAVQAVIARCAPADFTVPSVLAGMEPDDDEVLVALFGGPPSQRTQLRELASPAVVVHGDIPPFLVVHGTADEIVPFSQAETLVSALRGHGADVTFEVIDGGHHNLLADLAAPWGNQPWTDLGYQAVEFFTKYLTGR